MKTYFTLVIILLWIIGTVHDTWGQIDQEPNLLAVPITNGALLMYGPYLPKEGYYQIEKQTGKSGNYRSLGTTRAPGNKMEFEKRLREFTSKFPLLRPPASREVEEMWKYIQSHHTVDSLRFSSYPLKYLISGMGYVDETAAKDETHHYRVTFFDKNDNSIWQQESNEVNNQLQIDLPKPEFHDKSVLASNVLLQFRLSNTNMLATFQLFRRVFNKGEYQPVPSGTGFNLKGDTLLLYASDTTVQYPGYYQYRLQLVDIFGNPGPVSDEVTAGTLEYSNTTVLEFFEAKSTGKEFKIQLKWRLKGLPYSRFIEVYRSREFDQGYEMIKRLSPKDSLYNDVVPLASETYYYYLVMGGPTGKSETSARVQTLYRDTSIPEVPESVVAETVTGGVQIHWEYQQPHVKGFRLHRSTSPKAGFVNASDLLPYSGAVMQFTDTSSTLSGRDIYFYSVTAVSDSDMESEHSQVAQAVPGISRTLITPTGLEARGSWEGITVSWNDLGLIDDKILGYKLFRREENSAWKLVDSLDVENNYTVDSLVQTGKSYYYRIQAFDIFGWYSAQSEEVSVSIPILKSGAPAGIQLFSVPDGIQVTWGQIVGGDLNKIRIYRKQPGNEMKHIDSVTVEDRSYIDKNVETGQLYFYYLTYEDSKHIESDKSNPVSIRY